MQFKQVYIDDEVRWVFIFSKRDAEVLKAATRNKKAPIDERIIRFIEHRRLMWVTDGNQLVCLTAKQSEQGPTPETREWAVEVQFFKTLVTKAKISELIALDTSTGELGTIPKLTVEHGDTLAPKNIGTLALLEEGFDLTEPHLDKAMSRAPAVDQNDLVGAFRITTRFGATLGALTKATEAAPSMVFVAPAKGGGGARWVVDGDDLDGARWDVILMPLI